MAVDRAALLTRMLTNVNYGDVRHIDCCAQNVLNFPEHNQGQPRTFRVQGSGFRV